MSINSLDTLPHAGAAPPTSAWRSEEPVGQLHVAARNAERLLAEYMRAWGLRDPTMIAVHCHRWVSEAASRMEACQSSPGAEHPQSALARAAFEQARTEIEKWLDHLCQMASPLDAAATSRRGFVGMSLRKALDAHPEAFLQFENLPEPLVQMVTEAARPVVPAAAATRQMQGPPLGVMHPVLQPRRWRKFLGRLASAILHMVGH
jgi:hypothetical protein